MSESHQTPKTRARPHGIPGNERICTFSDGVFAIAITLLVLELQVPDQAPAGGLIELLPGYLPKLTGHVITFAILGIYWVAHHNMFTYVRWHDRVLLWLNILFLLFVAAMPFLTALIARYGDDQTAVVASAGAIMLAGLSLELMWWYATTDHRLVAPGLDPKLISLWHRRILLAPAAYLLAIGLSFISITATKGLFLCIAVAYIAPNPWDRYHHQQFPE